MGFFSRLLSRKPKVEADPRDLFFEEVRQAAFAKRGVIAVVRLESGYGMAVTQEGRQGQLHLYLDNLYAHCRQLPPQDRPAEIDRFLALLTEQRVKNATWKEARPRLLPVIRAPMFSGLPDAEAKLEPFCRELVPCLREHLVIDHPESMAYVRAEDVKNWGLTQEELFDTAYENLRPLAGEGVELYEEQPSPIWCVDSGDGYESSRLLLPGFLAAFAGKVEGRPIAVVPDRSMLFIGGDAHPRTVIRLCELAEREYAASTRNVSCGVYAVDGEGKLVPYLRAVEDEATSRVREAHLKFLGTEYGTQKAALDEHHQKTGVDVFVATFTGARDAKGQAFSYCTWVPEILSLLPKTSLVAIAQQEGKEDALWVSWADAMRIAGSCWRPEPGLYPPRWRTVSPPSPEQLAGLRAVEVRPQGGNS